MSGSRRAFVTILLVIILIAPGIALSKNGGKISAALKFRLDESGGDFLHKVWIYFADKDESSAAFQKVSGSMNPRVAARRANIPPNWYDLPVKEEYVEAVEAAGGQNVRASHWLNAVSARISADRISDLVRNDFIEKIDIVKVYRRRTPALDESFRKIPPPVDNADYGLSYNQNHQLGIDSLHRLTINGGIPVDGSGVLIAFLDSGYEPGHPAFDSMDIVDTWDFINDDATVNDDLPNFLQPRHGTLTLSACGGYAPGDLIGPAYGASYALYKTEITNSETEIEEDNWVLASERAELAGADIISTSLGYLDWYSYSDMDGNSAVTTIAADIAASLGILVVVSAGNEGDDPWHYINAPADGDSVIAVGAVTSSGIITSFSSFGPSYDGRVKPEMVAMGSGVWSANYTGGYTASSGTSLSCPLISGAAALIIQANPSLKANPMAVRERLIMAGDRYPVPDPGNRYGYGLPCAVVAAGFGLKIHPIADLAIAAGVTVNLPVTSIAPPGAGVTFEPIDFPASISFTDNGDGTGELIVVGDYDHLGAFPYRLAAASGDYVDTLEFVVTTTPNDHSEVFFVGPNPFREALNFRLAKPIAGGYTIEIFSLAGEMVFRHSSEANLFTWDGTNNHGQKIASGAYIIHFFADGIEEKVKVFKL